jgi:hypothetical protein
VILPCQDHSLDLQMNISKAFIMVCKWNLLRFEIVDVDYGRSMAALFTGV